MNKKLKFFFIAIAGIASFSLLFIVNFNLIYNPTTPPKESVNSITLIVDYKNGTIKVQENFTLDNEKTTAFNALTTWCKVEITDYGEMGIIVESVNDRGGNWRYSINNEFPRVSAIKYNLKNGDVVKWIFG